MTELIKAKVRKIGTSFGVILPKEMLNLRQIREGDEIEITVFKKDLRLLEKAFGMAKGAKHPFIRDRIDRLERLYGKSS